MKIYLISYCYLNKNLEFIGATKSFASAIITTEKFVNEKRLCSEMSWKIVPISSHEWICVGDDGCGWGNDCITILEVDLNE